MAGDAPGAPGALGALGALRALGGPGLVHGGAAFEPGELAL
jgi:hypothetical protein